MSVSVTVRDWDTWPLAPSEDIRFPIKMWFSDIESVGDATGGTHSVTFNIAEAGDPAADGVEAVGNMFGIIEAYSASNGGPGDTNVLIRMQAWTTLPGAIQQDRSVNMLMNQGTFGRDRINKYWLGHRIKNTPGLFIFSITNTNSEVWRPGIWLCEWTPEAYVSGGPIWPAMAG